MDYECDKCWCVEWYDSDEEALAAGWDCTFYGIVWICPECDLD